MSTGLDLLQRLRQQQQHVKQSQKKNKRYLQPAGIITGDKNKDTIQDVQKKTSSLSITTVEVCLGPDCSGGGGGAALLEIEDLVSCREKMNDTTTSTRSATYDNKSQNVLVVPGGCRDFCTMGPNVHVRNNAEKDVHYSRVNNPKKCRDIISSIYEEEEEERSSSVQIHVTKDSSVESLMRRREDSIRWQSYRERAARERRLKVRERNV